MKDKGDKISFRKMVKEQEFESIRELYCSAFPPEERREFQQLVQLKDADGCDVLRIMNGNKPVGFCIVWFFEDFLFTEHFAIEPEWRGQGTGSRVLALLREIYRRPVMLEVEPPCDEITSRRVSFYSRNGFYLLDRPYCQPSYGENKPEVVLRLMTSQAGLPPEKPEEYIAQIRKKVYRKEE